MKDKTKGSLGTKGAHMIDGVDINSGMTMRDYFAAVALQSYMTWSLDQPAYTDDTREKAAARYAKVSYEIADAMLTARDK